MPPLVTNCRICKDWVPLLKMERHMRQKHPGEKEPKATPSELGSIYLVGRGETKKPGSHSSPA
jgi:hypothetical protein